MIKTAILQVGHPGALESLVCMLQSVGVTCLLPSSTLRDRLKGLGCDTILDVESMAEKWGMKLRYHLGKAIPYDLTREDVLYVDTKAHRNGPKVWEKYPNLREHTLWYRINGGRPCDVLGKGPELLPPCPILTPNLWYGLECLLATQEMKSPQFVQEDVKWAPWREVPRYTMWPPFVRWDEFQAPRRAPWTPPVCLVHNVYDWGLGQLVDPLRRDVGLCCYGGWGSPDEITTYNGIPGLLSGTVAMVHLKSQDAPGYAIYESLAASCPLIVSRRLIESCRMEALLKEGVTCICYDRTDGEGQVIDEDCLIEISDHLYHLRDKDFSQRIGEAGRERLRQLMWSPLARSSTDSLAEFLGRAFP